MTKLTKQAHRQIYLSIVADIDFGGIEAEFKALRQMLVDALIAQMPKKVQVLWQDKELVPFLQKQHASYYVGLGRIHNMRFDYFESLPWVDGYLSLTEARAKIPGFAELFDKLKDDIYNAELVLQRIETAVNSCSSAATLKTRYPEWAKYLPETPAGATKALVDPSLVLDLAKLGWPKGKKVEEVAEAA